jgi:hypothetical protein
MYAHTGICRYMYAYVGICRHIQVYAGICRYMYAYVGICRHRGKIPIKGKVGITKRKECMCVPPSGVQ